MCICMCICVYTYVQPETHLPSTLTARNSVDEEYADASGGNPTVEPDVDTLENEVMGKLTDKQFNALTSDLGIYNTIFNSQLIYLYTTQICIADVRLIYLCSCICVSCMPMCCMYVCLYIYICIYIYLYIYVCMCFCLSVCIYIHVCVRLCLCMLAWLEDFDHPNKHYPEKVGLAVYSRYAAPITNGEPPLRYGMFLCV